jgi:sigma-B regulation protein RsbU (phosphoserine phosphatase)
MVEDGGEQRLQGTAVTGMFPPLKATAHLDLLMAKASHLKEHVKHEQFALGEGLVGLAAAQQRAILVEDAADGRFDLPAEVKTAMAAPMFSETRLEGVVVAVNGRTPNRRFTPADLRNLEHLAHQAAMASVLTGIYAERSRQERLFQELEFARQIQHSLLPEAIPHFGDYQLHAATRPALEVGGDFYDFIAVDENRLIILVADASGKGVPACMLMAMCQSFARVEAEHFTMMEEFLRNLNRHLYRDSDRSRFVTVAALMIDKENHVCEYARAGHTELLLRLESGKFRVVKPKGAAIGLLPDEFDIGFDTIAFSFTPGTSLLVFTDGITEALDENGTEFGLDRLMQIWTRQELPAAEAGEAIFTAVKEFAGNAPQADDQTVLVITRPRPAASPGTAPAPT